MEVKTMDDHISAAQCLITLSSSGGASATTSAYSSLKTADQQNHQAASSCESRLLMGRGACNKTNTNPTSSSSVGEGINILSHDHPHHHDYTAKEDAEQKCASCDHNGDKNFLLDLFLIISDGQTSFNSMTATWLPSGKSFMIVNERKFEALIVPVLLGEGAGVQDFILELYKWGFDSTEPYSSSSTCVVFWHKFFRKDHQHLLRKIIPIAAPVAPLANKKATSTSSSHLSSSFTTSSNRPAPLLISSSTKHQNMISSFLSSPSMARTTSTRHVSFDGDMLSDRTTTTSNSTTLPTQSPSPLKKEVANRKKRFVSFDDGQVEDPAFRANKRRMKTCLLSSSTSTRPASSFGNWCDDSKTKIHTVVDLSHSLNQFQQKPRSEQQDSIPQTPFEDSLIQRRRMQLQTTIKSTSSRYNKEMEEIQKDPLLYNQEMRARFEKFLSNRRQTFFFQKDQSSSSLDEDEFLHGNKGKILRAIAYPTSEGKKIVESALGVFHRGRVMDRISEQFGV